MIQYRRKTECFVSREAEADFPTHYGHFRIFGYINKLNGEHHVAIVKVTYQTVSQYYAEFILNVLQVMH